MNSRQRPKLLMAGFLLIVLAGAASAILIQSNQIRELYRMDGLTLATEESVMLKDWKVYKNSSPTASTLLLMKDDAQVTVTFKEQRAVIIEGTHLSVGSSSLSKGATVEAVHQLIGSDPVVDAGPHEGSPGDRADELYLKRDLLNRPVVAITVSYSASLVSRISISSVAEFPLGPAKRD